MVFNHNTIIETKSDVPLLEDLAIPIGTLANLRRVDSAGKLYRSSRQDLVSREDTEPLSHLGIRSVVDFRSKSEYNYATGEKNFDRSSDIVEVVIPNGRGLGSLEKTEGVPVKPVGRKLKDTVLKAVGNDQTSSATGDVNLDKQSELQKRRRFLIDFYKSNYIGSIFRRVPLYKRLISLIFLLVDVIFRTHFRYFTAYFAKEIINPAGLLGSYIDMLELSSTQICLALRILSDPTNLPALVSCAHGKDRTGIVVALVLAVLGKSDQYIVQEYALSEAGLDPIRSRVHHEIVASRGMDESFTHARQETMKGMLNYIQINYGSVPNYLESIGFTQEDQLRLVQTFQE